MSKTEQSDLRRLDNMADATTTRQMDRESIMTASAAVVPTVPVEDKAPRELLHSGNSGFIVHRVGQSNYGFHSEAREFAWALREYTNRTVGEYVTTRTYEE